MSIGCHGFDTRSTHGHAHESGTIKIFGVNRRRSPKQ
jgi:hypothetical protein